MKEKEYTWTGTGSRFPNRRIDIATCPEATIDGHRVLSIRTKRLVDKKTREIARQQIYLREDTLVELIRLYLTYFAKDMV